MSDTSADRLLARAARHCGGWLAIFGCASLAAVLAQLLLPAAIGRAVDAALHAHAAANWLLGCVLLAAVVIVAEAAMTLATGTASATAMAWLRGSIAGHAIACGPGLLRRFDAGDVVSRVTGGTADASAAPASMIAAVTAVIPPVGSVVALGLISPWLVVAFAAGFPALALVLRRLVRDAADISVAYQRAQGDIAARLLDALTGARTIAAAGTCRAEQQRILGPLARLRSTGEQSWRIQGRASAHGATIAPAMQVIVLGVAGVLLARHQITPGELIAASQYALLAVGLGASMGQLNRLGRARGGGRRVAELLAEPGFRYGARSPGPGPGELRFDRVTVRRGGQALLSDLDLVIPGGAAVAIVGRSGAGKSTLASLAGRLLDPDQGEVFLDGIPLRELSRAGVRSAIVHAFERPALFGATPEDAISFGAFAPARGDVLAAARDSRADAFLARLPHGMASPLRETPLSGGERQRLGLARAFAHAAPARLLILDDATSSLDTATEMLVSKVIAGQLSDRTRLIVAHRPATAASADLVAWLDHGRLRALASHCELRSEPEYRAVFGAEQSPC